MNRTAAIVVGIGVALAVAGSLVRATQDPDQARIEAVRLNTLGVANMTQQRAQQALELFEQAADADRTFATARLNQAIALYNLQRLEEARNILEALTGESADSTRAWYNLGLAYRNLGQPADAIGAFERATSLDPGDADAAYLLGFMYSQAARYDEATAAYSRALELRPYHASATFGMARAYALQGRRDEAGEWNARYVQIASEQLGQPMGTAYGDQGVYSLAEDASDIARRPSNQIEVRFTPVPGLDDDRPAGGAGPQAYLGGGACVLDYDNDGRQDLFLPDAGVSGGALYRNNGAGFDRVTAESGIELPGPGIGCAAGDYDNDGWIDLAVGTAGSVRLLRNTGNGAFADAPDAAGIDWAADLASFLLGLTFVDFDHDGDLDLFVVRTAGFPIPSGREPIALPAGIEPGTGHRLYRNNGDGTFTNWTAETALGGSRPGFAAIGTDINNDRAIDFVVTGWGDAPEILLNPRTGAFTPLAWTERLPAPPVGVIVADFDKDTFMDLAFSHWDAPGLSVWRNLGGTAFERVPIPDAGWTRGWGLTPVDVDNDGWIDLAALGETSDSGAIRVLRNRGVDGFEDVTSRLGLDEIRPASPRALVGVDYDNDGDIDLVATGSSGPALVLRNDGGNANQWLQVDLEGLADNRSAIGTKVEAFSGILRQKIEISSGGGYLGQSELRASFGLAENVEADTVRLLWPTGVPQDETQLAAGESHAILESDRRGSSCPVLFCWNGETYQFVTDAIGAGVVGHWVGPGQRNVSDPTEYIKVPGSMAALRDGRLSFRLAEPMEELVYLDQVRLIAVDHPAGVEVYPHEYFASVPRSPQFEVIASRDPQPPAGAWDDEGRDVSDELARIDRVWVDGFADTPFKGFARTHTLELDLGEVDVNGPLRLLMHGFIDYFSATSVFAAHQAGIEAILPYVEAEDASRRWVPVIDDLGFPAGLARTMARDITGRLPDRTRRIRITTNLKIYWDQILIDTTPDSGEIRLSEVPLAEATLGWLGYPRAVEGPIAADVRYTYDEVSPTGPYARHAGSYTRFGDVLDLAVTADDRFVVFGSGEEVALEFDPSGLPELENGWTRDYFFYADGFAKDMDFYGAHASTVEPFPYHTEEPYPYPSGRTYPTSNDHLDDMLLLNTRHASGRGQSAYRYDYD